MKIIILKKTLFRLFTALIISLLLFQLSCKKENNENTIENIIIKGEPCPGVATVTYEGEVYNTVIIGSQCWLKENLNVGVMINNYDTMKNNGNIEKYCYDNDPENCSSFGGLYTWDEMMQYDTSFSAGSDICPSGWHVPYDNDWSVLEGELDETYGVGHIEWDSLGWRGSNAGGNMKTIGTNQWHYPNIGATNISGFSALPGGFYSSEEDAFTNIKGVNCFWSSTSYSNSDSVAWFRLLSYTHTDVRRNFSKKTNAFSVRCIKNN